MTTRVEEKNQVTIPPEIAAAFNITPGTRLEWTKDDSGAIRVRPVTRAELARRIRGAGRAYLKPGDDPIADLIADRERDRRQEIAEGR